MLEFILKKKNLYRRSRKEDQKSIINKNERMIKNKYEIKRFIDQ